ncbi:MAG: hypothetical protein JRK53_03565 [Deltaproteobacteria bacterium]|nr:hypothetical protein [Deltaproteobacteria bacterium]MBW1816228.1 hypothetical protein [Deltaproteobacteria bacterium]
MAYRVEQECPQCGAPVELEETDRLIQCPYCLVKSFIFTPDHFRFVLPRKAERERTIYAPYLRFKGAVFFCVDQTIGYRVVDINHAGSSFNGLPVSLGMRPQALKMRYLSPTEESILLKVEMKPSDILKRAANLSSGSGPGQVFHRVFIGEALSVIYLPLFLKGNRLFDGVLDRPLTELSHGGEEIDAATRLSSRWGLTFIPTLCPGCGWNLDGERDSVVLFCANCESAWKASKGKFIRMDFGTDSSKDPDAVYMPFWKMAGRVQGLEIESFADYVRITNQPVTAGESRRDKAMYFWVPAFKIRPKLFLNLARHFTLAQLEANPKPIVPAKHRHPVTLPLSEAEQAVKITLAGSAMNKKELFPRLPGIRFEPGRSRLIYLPFRETVHDLIQEKTNAAINKNALAFGRSL